MTIERKIKLNDNIYYIVVDVTYKTNENNITHLCLKNYKYEYYDSGNLSVLIEKIEKNYSYEKALKYDSKISYMADVLYIYNRIPFLSGIKNVYIDKKNVPYYTSYISKNEIDKYIEECKIKMVDNTNFKFCDERTWFI